MDRFNWLGKEKAEAREFLSMGFDYKTIYELIDLQVGDCVKISKDYVLQSTSSLWERTGSKWVSAYVTARYPTFIVFAIPQRYAVSILNADLLFQEKHIIRPNNEIVQEESTMKNGKAPTREQKKILKAHGLVPENWFVIKNLPDTLEVVSRASLKKIYSKPRIRRISKSL